MSPGTAGKRPDVPAASVVIAAFAMERWQALVEAVASVQAQSAPATDIVVVIDHHPALLDRARRGLPDVTVIPNRGARGASGARNTGVAASRGEVVAFLDDDAVAGDLWLEALLAHFATPDVVGVGGRLEPLWAGRPPSWFPPEFGWTVGVSYRGMPTRAEPVRNVWSGNMAMRRQVFDLVNGFRAGFGKVGGRSRPEDTDLCLRAAAARPGGIWIYEPAGVAWHRVPEGRATVGHFLRRCFHEGHGKAALAALNGVGESTSAERHYTRNVLPRAVLHNVGEAVRGDAWAMSRGCAAAAGLSCALAGFAVGRSGAFLDRSRAARGPLGRQAPHDRQEGGSDRARAR